MGEPSDVLVEAVRVEHTREFTAHGTTDASPSHTFDVVPDADGTVARFGDGLDGVVSAGQLLFVVASDTHKVALASLSGSVNRLRRAEREVLLARQRPSPVDVPSAEEALRKAGREEREARAVLLAARKEPARLVDVPVVSPHEGTLVVAPDVSFDIGVAVESGAPVLRVSDAAEVEVWLDSPDDASAIVVGDAVELSLPGASRTWSGTVDRLGGRGGRQGRVTIANPDRGLPLFVSVLAKVRGRVDAYSIVPGATIRTHAGRSFVRIARPSGAGFDDVEVTAVPHETGGVAVRPALPRGALIAIRNEWQVQP